MGLFGLYLRTLKKLLNLEDVLRFSVLGKSSAMRKIIFIVITVGALAGAAWGGRGAYRHWKTERAVSEAKRALAASEYEKAILWLRRALAANGSHVEAVRMMGDLAETAQLPSAVAWRNRLLELEPASVTNRIMLARVALAQRDYSVAQRALSQFDAEAQETPEFLRLSGAVALGMRQFEEAAKRLDEAVRLEPGNPVPAVQLAGILVQRDDARQASRGLAMLKSLQTNPLVRVDALRHLTFNAFRHTNSVQALRLVEELLAERDSNYEDRLLHLNLLIAAGRPESTATLARYQVLSATNAQHAFELGRWMLRARGSRETVSWLGSLSSTIYSNLPVAMVVSDAYLGTTNWMALQKYLGGQQWGEAEYLRHLYLCRALREQGLQTAAKAEWSKVTSYASGNLERLKSLQTAAARWGWPAEAEEVLWLIVNRFPGERDAAQALSDQLYVTGKSRSLLSLYVQLAKREPNNLSVQNNLASLALLLNAEEHQPHELARRNFERNSTNAPVVATYAYSLFLQKRPAEGLRVFQAVGPAELERVSIAGYYGLTLSATGDIANARRYLDLAGKGLLLPEERALFQRARR